MACCGSALPLPFYLPTHLFALVCGTTHETNKPSALQRIAPVCTAIKPSKHHQLTGVKLKACSFLGRTYRHQCFVQDCCRHPLHQSASSLSTVLPDTGSMPSLPTFGYHAKQITKTTLWTKLISVF